MFWLASYVVFIESDLQVLSNKSV